MSPTTVGHESRSVMKRSKQVKRNVFVGHSSMITRINHLMCLDSLNGNSFLGRSNK